MYEAVLGEDLQPVPEHLKVRANTGMVGVVPSWKIAEVLDLPELQGRREEFDAKLAEHTFIKADSEQAQS